MSEEPPIPLEKVVEPPTSKLKLRRQLTEDEKAWQARSPQEKFTSKLGSETQFRLEAIRRSEVKPVKFRARMIWLPTAVLVVLGAGLYLYRHRPPPPPPPAPKLPIATLVETAPGLRLERNDQFPAVAANMELFSDDVLRTEKQAGAKIGYLDGTTVAITADSRVKIWCAEQAQRLFLIQGMITCDVARQPQDQALKVYSEYAEAEAQFAKFRLRVDDALGQRSLAGSALLVVDNGKVSFMEKAGRTATMVAAGQYAEAKEGDKPSAQNLTDQLDWWRDINWRGNQTYGQLVSGKFVEEKREQRLTQLQTDASKFLGHLAEKTASGQDTEAMLTAILMEPDILTCHEMRMRFRLDPPQPDWRGDLLLGLSPGYGVGLRLRCSRPEKEGGPTLENRLILMTAPLPDKGPWQERVPVACPIAFQEGKEYLVQIRVKQLSKRWLAVWGKAWEATAKEPDWLVHGLIDQAEGKFKWGVQLLAGNNLTVVEAKFR